ncbi:hypothetical protein TRIUR3_30864 [Triticum urartu]|uniref:Uncharacterized protein n=1 Tax=Triticum urartu TaxID=4572 RepID=M7Z2U3_TRIUA|nr:hypothetical protein TRIUR3_30864 [Triticum urartu]
MLLFVARVLVLQQVLLVAAAARSAVLLLVLLKSRASALASCVDSCALNEWQLMRCIILALGAGAITDVY